MYCTNFLWARIFHFDFGWYSQAPIRAVFHIGDHLWAQENWRPKN